jgi:hypothetical protein
MASPRENTMNPSTDADVVENVSTKIHWNPRSRIALVRYAVGASLVGTDGPFLVEALTGWIGASGESFGVLADGAGLRGTNAEYRASVSRFFRQHRNAANIALINLGPVIQIVVDMFRVGTGVQLKAFPDEGAARSWLRTKGVGT